MDKKKMLSNVRECKSRGEDWRICVHAYVDVIKIECACIRRICVSIRVRMCEWLSMCAWVSIGVYYVYAGIHVYACRNALLVCIYMCGRMWNGVRNVLKCVLIHACLDTCVRAYECRMYVYAYHYVKVCMWICCVRVLLQMCALVCVCVRVRVCVGEGWNGLCVFVCLCGDEGKCVCASES